MWSLGVLLLSVSFLKIYLLFAKYYREIVQIGMHVLVKQLELMTCENLFLNLGLLIPISTKLYTKHF